MITSKTGICVTDTWHLMSFHSLFPLPILKSYIESKGSIPIKAFAGALSAQLLKLADIEDEKERTIQKRTVWDLVSSSSEDDDANLQKSSDEEENYNDDINNNLQYITNAGRVIKGCKPVKRFVDGNENIHTLAKFPIVQTGKNMKKRARVQSCKTFGKETTMFCVECGAAYCYSDNGNGHGRKCFCDHLP